MLEQLQRVVSLIIRCHKSWAVAAAAVFGVTQLGAPAVCNVRPVKYGAFDKRFWHVTLTLWLTYRTINFKQHLLYTNISLIHLIIQTLWSFVDLKYCICNIVLINIFINMTHEYFVNFKELTFGKTERKSLHCGS